MQGEDDLRGLAKIMGFMRAVSIIVLLMHFYWYCYSIFIYKGWDIKTADKILMSFNSTAGLFSHPIYSKIFTLLLLALSRLGIKGVKNEKNIWRSIYFILIIGSLLFLFNSFLLSFSNNTATIVYILSTGIGYILLMQGGVWMSRLLKTNLMTDVFNNENESFQQETKLLYNEYSINLPTKFYFQGKWHQGWINIVNPFRATIVLSTPGSGKSYAVVNNYIKQHIEKGFSMYIYDFKFDDLSTIAYNHLLKNQNKLKRCKN